MPPPNPPQNAGQSIPWTSAQDAEAMHVSAGYRDALTFVLVPRTRLEFGPPDNAASQKLKNPGELFIEVPIRGKAVNFEPGVTLDCELSWLVLPDGVTQPKSHPVGNAKMVIAADGTFEIKAGGKPPVLDIITHQVINNGKLGYVVTPSFPHAQPSAFPPAITFKNVCGVNVTKPGTCLVGTKVSFSPHFSSVLNKADLELRIVELDEGSSEIAFGPERYAFSHHWGPRALWMIRNTTSVDWAIGFTSDTCDYFTDVGDEEAGAYEFAWQLWGRSKEGAPQTKLLEDKEFLRLPRPRLEELRVEFDKSWEGTWEVHGKISGVDPAAKLKVEVALVEPPPPEPGTAQARTLASSTLPLPLVVQKPALTPLPPSNTPAPLQDHRTASVRVQLHPDGVFEAFLGERHWMPEWTASNPQTPVDPPKAYAILTLPAAARDGKPGPIAPYLDFDDTRYSPIKADRLCWDFDAEWVCSEEGVAMVTRPPRPTRRPAGLTPRPAPPVDAGDQKTPMDWKEVWSDIVAWENIIPFMYQDNNKNVTVGAGNLLKYLEPKQADDPLAAGTLPFQNMDAGRPATPQEITEAFNKVVAMPPKMTATRYATRPKIALTDAFIEAQTKKRFENEFLKSIKNGLPDFETYPRAARRGIVDVTYNVGISVPLGTNSKWSAFLTAVKARKWAAAAAECTKNKPVDGNAQRTQWREDLFRYAAKVDWKKPGS
jgi:GH24 family phage-related lysozyme (muramidase)